MQLNKLYFTFDNKSVFLMLRKFVMHVGRISCSPTSCLCSNDFSVSSNHMETYLRKSNSDNKEKIVILK